MNETKFRSKARKAIEEYWNENKTLVGKFGKIKASQVYVVWECKIIGNNKGLFGLPFDGDGMYFEFTWNGEAEEGYLDVYKKQKNVLVK